MKYKWLNKHKGNKDLIIFFNGWGMDESVVKHIEPENYDVVMFYDYNNLDTDFVLPEYETRNIIAWSMGVMIGSKFDFRAKNSTAINGTLKPIDPEYGIHPKIYDLTIRGFNEKGRLRFIQNMFEEPTELKISRELENQKSELAALKEYCADENFKYSKVLISDNDKIIPTKSQTNFWGIDANLKSGHCPFSLFKKWSEIL